MKYNIFGLFGKKETTANVASIEIVNATTNVASIEPIKNEGETTLHTLEEVEAMTLEKVLETLENQYTEHKATILARCTTTAKIKKELEKAEAKEKETLAAYTTATMVETTEKKKATTKYIYMWWCGMKEALETMYTEAVKKEAEKKAHTEELKKKATEVLEAVNTGNMTMEEAVATLTTEELEAMKAVATEEKKAKKEKALEATNKATEATTMEKATTVAVALRHREEGRSTEKEEATIELAYVETEKATIMAEANKILKELEKVVADKVKAEVKKEYTISRVIDNMKKEAEAWQSIYNMVGVNIDVATMTPANIFANIHVFLQVPTGEGLKAGTGRGVKPVEKWTLEALHGYIITNHVLHTMELEEATLEAHRHTLQKAEKALETLKAVEELKKKAKEEKKAKKEKADTLASVEATPVATLEELETANTEAMTATNNEKALEKVVAEVKEEATEALAEVKAEKVETMGTTKKARRQGKKATEALEKVKATKKATKKEEKAVAVA